MPYLRSRGGSAKSDAPPVSTTARPRQPTVVLPSDGVATSVSQRHTNMEENSMQCVGWRAGPLQNFPRDEGDVSIECLQSSEFVIGKQANFNGAVTIINCEDAPGGQCGQERKMNGTEEKIIIKDKVLTPTQEVNGKKGKLADLIKTVEKWRAYRKKLEVFALSALVCIAILFCIVVGLVVLLPAESTGTDPHPFYSKEAWKGKPPTSVVKMKLPIPYVVVSHTVTPSCKSLRACTPLLQNMQEYHQNLDFSDIVYNFLLDSKGGIYEGRGWESKNVNVGFVHGRSIDIAFIGDYSKSAEPTEEMIDGLRYLLDFGLANDKLSRNYSLLAANATYATASPGKNVYNIIKDWPHFDPNPEAHIKELDE